jgi:hypothetical protein
MSKSKHEPATTTIPPKTWIKELFKDVDWLYTFWAFIFASIAATANLLRNVSGFALAVISVGILFTLKVTSTVIAGAVEVLNQLRKPLGLVIAAIGELANTVRYAFAVTLAILSEVFIAVRKIAAPIIGVFAEVLNTARKVAGFILAGVLSFIYGAVFRCGEKGFNKAFATLHPLLAGVDKLGSVFKPVSEKVVGGVKFGDYLKKVYHFFTESAMPVGKLSSRLFAEITMGTKLGACFSWIRGLINPNTEYRSLFTQVNRNAIVGKTSYFAQNVFRDVFRYFAVRNNNPDVAATDAENAAEGSSDSTQKIQKQLGEPEPQSSMNLEAFVTAILSHHPSPLAPPKLMATDAQPATATLTVPPVSDTTPAAS